MPRITFQGPDVLSSDERTNTEPKLPKRTIRMTTHWCLQCFRHTIRYWDDIAYEVECTIDATSPDACEFCEAKGIKCDWVPQGIRGHVFELMALLECVKKYWTDYSEDVYDQVADMRRKTVFEKLCDAVRDLGAAFDDLVDAHSKAHMLTGHVSDEAKASYFAWCNARQHMIRPITQYPKELHHQYAIRATEHIRLRMGEEASISWAAAICALYHAIKNTVEGFTGPNNFFFTSTDIDYIKKEFPPEIPAEL
ncbi:unnamed protein product [Penicillium palitans]